MEQFGYNCTHPLKWIGRVFRKVSRTMYQYLQRHGDHDTSQMVPGRKYKIRAETFAEFAVAFKISGICVKIFCRSKLCWINKI